MPTTDLSTHDTFPKLLLQHATQHAGLPAMREKRRGIWQTRTWSALADEVRTLAAALAASGLQPGSHVALIGDNRPRLYAAMCATQWLGGVVVPLHPDAAADELALPLSETAATHVFAEDQEQVDKVLGLLPTLRSITTVVYDNDRGMRHYAQPQLVAYEAFVERGREHLAKGGEPIDAAMLRRRGDDPAFVFYAADTTGRPRGVMLSHAALIDRARRMADLDRLRETDTALAYLPPAWIGQCMFSYVQPMVAGYCVACPESAETMLADLREIGPTYFFAPPRVLKTLVGEVTARMDDAGALKRRLYAAAMDNGRRRARGTAAGGSLAGALQDLLIRGPLRDVLGMSRLRVAYTAGDAVGADLFAFFRAIGVNLKQAYGPAEAGLFVCVQPDGQARAETVGPAAPGVELAIGDREELLVRSPGLFAGYVGDPAATRDAEGWFHTGDAARLGADGHVRVFGRVTDVGTLRDGSRFAPRPVEAALEASAFVKRAVAIGADRDRVCVLLDVDATALTDWAARRGLNHAGATDLVGRDETVALLSDWVAQVNLGLSADPEFARSQIHRFALLNEGLVTSASGSFGLPVVDRIEIAVRHRALIEAMYAGHRTAPLDPGADDGHGTATDVRIHDARLSSDGTPEGARPSSPRTPTLIKEAA